MILSTGRSSRITQIRVREFSLSVRWDSYLICGGCRVRATISLTWPPQPQLLRKSLPVQMTVPTTPPPTGLQPLPITSLPPPEPTLPRLPPPPPIRPPTLTLHLTLTLRLTLTPPRTHTPLLTQHRPTMTRMIAMTTTPLALRGTATRAVHPRIATTRGRATTTSRRCPRSTSRTTTSIPTRGQAPPTTRVRPTSSPWPSRMERSTSRTRAWTAIRSCRSRICSRMETRRQSPTGSS